VWRLTLDIFAQFIIAHFLPCVYLNLTGLTYVIEQTFVALDKTLPVSVLVISCKFVQQWDILEATLGISLLKRCSRTWSDFWKKLITISILRIGVVVVVVADIRIPVYQQRWWLCSKHLTWFQKRSSFQKSSIQVTVREILRPAAISCKFHWIKWPWIDCSVLKLYHCSPEALESGKMLPSYPSHTDYWVAKVKQWPGNKRVVATVKQLKGFTKMHLPREV